MWISEILYLKCQISNHSSTNTEITRSSICQDFCTSISGSRDFFVIGSTVLLLCSAHSLCVQCLVYRCILKFTCWLLLQTVNLIFFFFIPPLSKSMDHWCENLDPNWYLRFWHGFSLRVMSSFAFDHNESF